MEASACRETPLDRTTGVLVVGFVNEEFVFSLLGWKNPLHEPARIDDQCLLFSKQNNDLFGGHFQTCGGNCRLLFLNKSIEVLLFFNERGLQST